MHTVLEVRSLRDVLVTGTCQWKKLNRRELEEFRAEIQQREDAGEVVGTVRKKRADAGRARKRKGPAVDVVAAAGDQNSHQRGPGNLAVASRLCSRGKINPGVLNL